MKRQTIDWDKIFAKHGGLILKYILTLKTQ